MIQRGSNTITRNVIIGSVIIIMLITVLYYMKRVEVGRLKREVDSMSIQRTDREDELNRKLTEYLQKLEDMTRQLGDINSRLQDCDNNKALITSEMQKCKSTSTKCESTRDALNADLKASQTELTELKGRSEKVDTQLVSHRHEMDNVRQTLSNAERELQQCEEERETCQEDSGRNKAVLQACQQEVRRAGNPAIPNRNNQQQQGVPYRANANSPRLGNNQRQYTHRDNAALDSPRGALPSPGSRDRGNVGGGGGVGDGDDDLPVPDSLLSNEKASDDEHHVEEIVNPGEIERQRQNEQEKKEIEEALKGMGGDDGGDNDDDDDNGVALGAAEKDTEA